MAYLRRAALRQRAISLSLFAALALAGLPLAGAHAADRWERAVTGQWKLTAALDGAEMTSLDEKEAARLVGRVFTIRRDAVKFGERTCSASDFEAERVSPKAYFPEQFRASPEKLGLPNPVTAVDLSCTTVFIKSSNKLVIFWDGWFFDAVRVRHPGTNPR